MTKNFSLQPSHLSPHTSAISLRQQLLARYYYS